MRSACVLFCLCRRGPTHPGEAARCLADDRPRNAAAVRGIGGKHSFPSAATTECHQPHGFKQQRLTLSRFWRPEADMEGSAEPCSLRKGSKDRILSRLPLTSGGSPQTVAFLDLRPRHSSHPAVTWLLSSVSLCLLLF